jgi:sigma-B regulation protein RsbU (phosphoserine phosphatase)
MPDISSCSFTLMLRYAGEEAAVTGQTPFTIGRSPEMDLVLPYPFISRRQAAILFDPQSHGPELICSGASCFVNGESVSRRVLETGDEIRFGSLHGPLLRFTTEAPVAPSLRETLSGFKEPSAARAELATLTWFVEAARRLNDVGALHEVLAALIDITLELTKVERAYVFLKDSTGELTLAAGRSAQGDALDDSSTLSRSAIRQAIASGLEFVVTDTLSAEAAAPSESIVMQSIRAILCIPLRRRSMEKGSADSQVMGVLYLDSRQQRSQLTRLDSELLHTIAVEAALLVENASLVQEEMAARRYREELVIASEIQQSLMSIKIPKLDFAEISANSMSCKGIGGDFYDVLCHDNALYIVVADVSGKGISAAVLGSTLQGLIHGQILSGLALPEIALFANQYICHKDVRKYCTLILLRVTREGPAEYMNCGHVPLFMQLPDGSLSQPENCNLPVGLFPGATYASEPLQLMPGQRLFLLTDGVTEAEDPSACEFGDGPLQSLIADGSTLETIFAQILRFTANSPLQDDCTMVEVRYRPNDVS